MLDQDSRLERGPVIPSRIGGRLRWLDDRVRLATQVGFVVFAAVSLLYLELGQLNADEGWYLYASKLVLSGLLPYRDYAYTQMPLLPYVYGVLQVVSPGLVMGRLTSVVLSLGTAAMGIVIARRLAGARAGAVTAWFFCAFAYGAYFNSIVKTYALVSFCLTASSFFLLSRLSEERRFPLAAAFGLIAAMVRVTAVFFVAPVLLYALLVARRGATRAAVLLEGLIAAAAAAVFLLPDWPAAQWGLFDSHLRHWAGAQVSTQLDRILAERLPDAIQSYGLVLVLFSGATYFLFRSRGLRALLTANLPLCVATLGLALFAAAHLVNGLWDAEYLVPAMTAFLPIVSVVVIRAYDELESASRVLVRGMIVASLVLLALAESIAHVDVTGRRLPLAEVDTVAASIREYSRPSDPVLALEALASVLAARRSTLPGLSLAQFSVQLVDDQTAERLHVVNTGMLVDAVDRQDASVVVLTENDWGLLRTYDPPSAAALQRALDERYRLVLTMPLFGEYAHNVFVYSVQ